MNADRRAVLEGIAYGDDPRLTATDRLRALEFLRDEDDDLDAAGHWIARQVVSLSDDALDRELAQYMEGGWPSPPEPDGEPVLADEWGARLLDVIAVEDGSTRYPEFTRKVAALALAMLPALDGRRVQAEVERQVAERIEALRAGDEAKANVVPLRPVRPSDGDPTQQREDASELVPGTAFTVQELYGPPEGWNDDDKAYMT